MSNYEPERDDEFSDDENERRMEDDDVEGEEDASVRFVENGIIIEPFNMRKERNEGFISQGHYIENRSFKDAWLDQIEAAEKQEADKLKKKSRKYEDDAADDSHGDDEEEDEEANDAESSMGMRRKKKGLRSDRGDSDDDKDVEEKGTNDSQAEAEVKRKKILGKRKAKVLAEERLERQAEEEALERQKRDTPLLRQQLLTMLRPGETVLLAIKRLGSLSHEQQNQQEQGQGQSSASGSKYGKARIQQQKLERQQKQASADAAARVLSSSDATRDSMDVAEVSPLKAPVRRSLALTANQIQAQTQLSALTEAADILLAAGVIDIYSESYDSLSASIGGSSGSVRVNAHVSSAPASTSSTERDYFTSSGGPSKASAVDSGKQWQYKLGPTGAVFGPFPTEHMRQWFQQGYLACPQGIFVRTFDSYTDDDDPFVALTQLDALN